MSYDLLENMTAVEISTVIVNEIVDEVFIPWEVYQGIYDLGSSTINLNVVPSLRSRYLELRRQLELAYCLLAIDRNSALYKRAWVKEIQRDLPLLTRHDFQWETLTTRLPEPIPHRHQTMSQVNQLLSDRAFLGILQQLHQRKVALDRRNYVLQNASDTDDITDSTYAQTSWQLDGKIINRYDRAILDRSDRELLLQLHKESTAAGKQQWQGMIKFVLSVFQKPVNG